MIFNVFEQQIIKYWNENNITDKVKQSRSNKQQWEFLDGPPFVNGNPHHGHLLVSSIKDTMARYMSQKGYQISYQIGFDCHGLPLEQEAEKTVGKVSPNDSLEKLTMFNDKCRDIISNCSERWYETLERLGRQFDKSKTYCTSDGDYMESLWWAFKTLWDKNLIYCSKKVMPYSPLCETPLSNFEANSNYQERTDISVYVKFKIVDSDENLLIWTTTPWSLFGNQGICVNPELMYCLVEESFTNSKVWVCEDLLTNCFGIETNYLILNKKQGKELKGLKYLPIFPIDNWSNYQVYCDSYVQNKSGTGLVHLAPLFGEDDMRVMKLNGYIDLNLPLLVDSQVKFIKNYDLVNTNIKEQFVMNTSTDVVIYLKKNGHAIKSEKIKHNYPYCWRTDHPLVYLATDAWFMNVQKIIPDIMENNKQINWYPSYVGSERFANWIKDSPDWCLSRNRVWGTPIPVWISDDLDMLCIGSIDELEKYTGKKYYDIHLDKIEDVQFIFNGKKYVRTFGVLDCWFESGMAGLARFGYPSCVDKSYPVDFIAESLDQTRGWFYTLNVLSTALNNKPAFKNVIVSGLILAADGKKMSKRLGNYTSPNNLIEQYGADVLRMYLIGSPATKAEPFCFKDSDLTDITKRMIPYHNAHLLLNECLITAKETHGIELKKLNNIKSINKLDIWIENKFMETSKQIYTHMEKLELSHIPNLIYKFIDNLTNFYIKLSRDRLKSQLLEIDAIESLFTLYSILNRFNILLAPFMPHFAEYYYMSLYNLLDTDEPYESVHMVYINIKKVFNYQLDDKIINGFYSINDLLETVRNMREQINKPIYYPILNMELYTDSEDIKEFISVISSELNIKQIDIYSTSQLTKQYKPNRGLLGKYYKKDAYKYITLIENGDICWDGCNTDLYTFDYLIEQKENMISSKFNYINNSGKSIQSIVYLNKKSTPETECEAELNNIRRQINILRKEMGFKMFNKINIIFENNKYWSSINNNLLSSLFNKLSANILFEDELNEFKIIKTFNDKEIKVLIK